jgi:serine/threonine protein kinase/WD40 repeat protein
LGNLEPPTEAEAIPQSINPAIRPSTIHLRLGDDTGVAPVVCEFGDYELLSKIGQGGMGIIFKARQRSLDRLVAIKLINSGRLAKSGEIARFRTEATAAARLHHPQIVRIYEVGEHEGQQFISMEFVPGRSLAEALRDGPWSPNRAAGLLRNVAEAIEFAHQRGVLHRDLKPSNILLDAEGQARVADFGLAKILEANSELTISGAIIGSPGYMPPEQAEGRSAQASVRSDVYSLGAILYDLLTGHPPFAAHTPLQTMKLVVEREPVAPRALNASLPRDLESICLKCLAKDPARRYESAQHLFDELGRFLRREPIRARPVSTTERVWRGCRRNPALAALGVALAAVPAIIITILLLMDARESREQNNTRQDLYAADIALAAQALKAGDYDVAQRSLAAYRPGNLTSKQESQIRIQKLQPAADLRGFEWHWLWHEIRGDARQIFALHRSRINGLAYSPDGRFVATSSLDGTARLWNEQKLLRTFREPDNPRLLAAYTDQEYLLTNGFAMLSVGFTADGSKLLTGSEQGLSAWDPETGQQLWSLRTNLPGTTNLFTLFLPSPTDPNLALAMIYYPRMAIVVVDLRSRQLTSIFTNGRADTVSFTPDGRQFARWDKLTRRISLHQILSGETTASFDSAATAIEQMVFTPDGRTLAACNLNRGRIELFDLASQQLLAQLGGERGRLETIAISPYGNLLASGGYDQTIRIWDLASRRELRKLRGNRSAVRGLAFSPDGQTLASVGFDRTLVFWDVMPPPSPLDFTNVFGAFAFSTDGRWLVTQNSNALCRLWELPIRLVQEWETPRFQSAVFTTNALLTASIGSSNDPPCVRRFEFEVQGSTSKVQGSLLNVSGSSPAKSVASGNTTNFLTGLASPCSAIALSHDGALTATGHHDGTIALWETRSGELLRSVKRALGASIGYKTRRTMATLNPLVFSADGRTLAAASFDGVEVKSWTLPELRQLGNYIEGAQYELPLALSPDGRQLAMGGSLQGLSINLWDIDLRRRTDQLRGQQDKLYVVAYSPDGRTLASGASDGLLKLWHLPTKREIASVKSLPNGINFGQLTFSPDGSWLGVSDTAGHLYLWNAPGFAEGRRTVINDE